MNATQQLNTSDTPFEDLSSAIDVSPLIGEVSFSSGSISTSPSSLYDPPTPSFSSDVYPSSSSQRHEDDDIDADADVTAWTDPSDAIDWNAVVFDDEMEALWRDSQGAAMKLFEVGGDGVGRGMIIDA